MSERKFQLEFQREGKGAAPETLQGTLDQNF